MSTSVVLVDRIGSIGYITLNRPERLNAINDELPSALAAAVDELERDDNIRCIVVQGAGKGFCSGYDLQEYAQKKGKNFGWQDSTSGPWDPMIDYAMMMRNTQQFMSLWRCLKPTIARIHGAGAVAGGSDIAMCCDLIIMSETARIGYPPARVWGCPTTAMWAYRGGTSNAKQMLLTGDLVDGREAFRMGIATSTVPEDQLDAEVQKWAQRIATVPANQLAMQKLMINHTMEQQGLASAQKFATLFDGIARHTPEGAAFKKLAEQSGWKAAVNARDKPKSKL